jgi:hypothetical protein
MSQRADAAGEPPAAGEQPIRVLLVDDHAVVRRGLRALLDREPGIEVTSEATVRSHVSSILRKLQLASRTQAALYALRAGLARSRKRRRLSSGIAMWARGSLRVGLLPGGEWRTPTGTTRASAVPRRTPCRSCGACNGKR